MGKIPDFFLFLMIVTSQITENNAMEGGTRLYLSVLRGYELYYFNQSVSWETADGSCRNYGGSLVMPKNKPEVQSLLLTLYLRQCDRAWIGLKKQGNVWQWNDGSSTPVMWAIGEPNDEECGMLKTSEAPKGINDVWCTRSFHYVCQISTKLPQKTTTTTTVTKSMPSKKSGTSPITQIPQNLTTGGYTSGAKTEKHESDNDGMGEGLAIGIPVALAICIVGGILVVFVIYRRNCFLKKNPDIAKDGAQADDAQFQNDLYEDGTLTFTTMRNNSLYGQNEDENKSHDGDDGTYCMVDEVKGQGSAQFGKAADGNAAVPYDDVVLDDNNGQRPYENVSKPGVAGINTATSSSQEDISQLYAKPQKKDKKQKIKAVKYDDTLIDSSQHTEVVVGNRNGPNTDDISNLYAKPQKRPKTQRRDVYDNTEVEGTSVKIVNFESETPAKEEGYETIKPEPKRDQKSRDKGTISPTNTDEYENTADWTLDTNPEPPSFNIYESIKR